MLRLTWFLLLLGCLTAGAQGWDDGFDGKALGARWQWRVPVAGPTLSLTDRPGWLRIQLPDRPGGYNHWNEPTPVDEAAQLRTSAPAGDWELEARVNLQPVAAASHFHVGLVAGVSDEHLVVFGPFQAATLAGGPKTPEACLEPTGLSGFFRVPGDARDLRLRLGLTGTLCRAQLSRDGKTWVEAGAAILPARPRFVGLIGKTFSGGAPVTFDVDYVRLTSRPPWVTGGRRLLVGVGGEYPTGYCGLLARLGLPYEALLDYQLTDAKVLRRFGLLLVSGRGDTVAGAVREAMMDFVRGGGTVLLDSGVFPPPTVVAGKGGRLDSKSIPDILVGGVGNPLLPFLGEKTRFAAGESRYHFEPAALEGLQVLARFDGQPGRPGPAAGYTGAAAIWAKPLGRGVLIYSSPAIGASLSWGPTHDALAEALILCLGWGHLQPQLIEEGARFGRKQSGLTEAAAPAAAAAPPPVTFAWTQLEVPPEALPTGADLLKSRAAPEFNLSGTYRPEGGEAQLLLNHWSSRYQVTATFKGASVRLTRTENGKSVDSAETALDGLADIPFVVKERRDRIVFVAGMRRAALRADGLWEGKLGSAGQGLAGLRYQPVEPAWLNDDFMRGEKEQGAWELVGGQWAVRATGDPKMGVNPFTYLGKAKGSGMAVAGLPFWDEYAFSVSVKPVAADGTVGQGVCFRDQGNTLIFRVRLSDSAARAKDGAEIVRVAAGKESVLARGDACLVKGQWYRLSVQVRDGVVTACIDGRQVATAEDPGFAAGKVALCLRDSEAEFDDVAVRPPAVAAAPALVELDGTVPRFAGTLDRDTWAGTALQWRADPCVPGLFWRRGRFWGDLDLTFRCDFGDQAGDAAAMALLLTPVGGTADSGYRLSLQPTASTKPWDKHAARGNYLLKLSRQGTPVGHCSVTANAVPGLELRRVGSRLLAWVDGHEALQCQMQGQFKDGLQLGFQATGFRPRLSGLRLTAGNVLDTCFDHAPTDWWVGSGTWELAVRWPCTPEWSWLAGESRGVAALWHKRAFVGDVLLDLHVGPRTVDHGDGRPREICRAFNVVLCGDGQEVRSGYSFVVGAGKDGAGATLTRNGQVVAQNAAYRIFSDAHNQWLNVRAEKQGPLVCLWVGDQCILSWEDPEPLPGGRLGVWTEDNSIMIPRVTIYHG